MSDKDGVLNIRKDMYGGLDFLPDMYDQMVSAANGKAFLAHDGDRIVSDNTQKNIKPKYSSPYVQSVSAFVFVCTRHSLFASFKMIFC